ncbi:MAG: exodeoxyribonuclease VII large subunit, partial [Nocardioides sp.]
VEIADLRDRARRSVTHALARAGDDIAHQRARARSLSPLATLQRGYAVVQLTDGAVLTSTGQAAVGDDLSIRLADGRLLATTSGVEPVPEEDHE